MWLQADHLLSLGVGPNLSPRPLKIFLQVSKHPSSHFYDSLPVYPPPLALG